MAFSSDLLIKVDSGEFIFKKLTLGDTIKPFKCNNQDLADFLINDAKIYLKYLRYTTFIIESRDITVAYYSPVSYTHLLKYFYLFYYFYFLKGFSL